MSAPTPTATGLPFDDIRALVASMPGPDEGARAAAESGGALVSPACDAAALAENLRILAAETPAARAAMGDKAYAYYETHYRREALLHELEAFIL